MLDGSRIIITPIEGGGYSVEEQKPESTATDMLAFIGMVTVVMLSVNLVLTVTEWAANRRK